MLALLACACASDPGSSSPLADAGATSDAGAVDARAPTDAGASSDAGALDADGAPDAEVSMRTVNAYVALGSSSTAGSGASAPDRAYVALLTADLRARFPSVQLTNFGQGGATVGVFLQNVERIRTIRPELVTILPFTDYVATATTTFRSSYTTLLDALGSIGATVFFGDLRVDPALVCGVGRGPGGCYSTDDRDKLGAKSAILAELAATRPYVKIVPVLDQNVAHPEWIATDGSHPNDLGHQYLADTFWAPISAWLDGT